MRASHVSPGMRHHLPGHAAGQRHGAQARLNAVPASGLGDRENRQGRETGHDQQKLEDLIVYGAGEPAEEGIDQNDGGRDQNRHIEVPAQHQLQQLAQGIHGDSRGKDGHHGEGESVVGARLLVVAHFEVLGNGAGFAAVVERHHENSHEQDGRNGADPIEVGGHDAILGAGGGHADEFLGAEVGRDECQAGDPDGNRTPGKKEIAAGGHLLPKHPPDA